MMRDAKYDENGNAFVNVGGSTITMFRADIARVDEYDEPLFCNHCPKNYRLRAIVRIAHKRLVFNSDMRDACIFHIEDAITEVMRDKSDALRSVGYSDEWITANR
jgi:hypothetical protein